MIIDRLKFITKWSLHGLCIFHFYCWNPFKVIPWPVHSVQETSPRYLWRRTRVDGIQHIRRRRQWRSTIESRDMSVMTENRDVEMCKSFNLKKPSASSRILYCGHSTQCNHLHCVSKSFTGPISLGLDSCLYVLLYISCMCRFVTWWGRPGGIEAWFLGLLLPSVLWHCRLGHLTRKNPSPIWPITCLVGR